MARRAIVPNPLQPGRELPPPALPQIVLRRRRVLGILLLAAAILVFALLRADRHVLFPPGWWRW
ncbi:MAG TPA: hypothetical protein VIY53_17935 [Acidobacteriaceae bacterium]